MTSQLTLVQRMTLEAAQDRSGDDDNRHEAMKDLLLQGATEIARLTAERDAFRRNLRDTFDAMCAMRNSINEYLPMPSIESDLLQGPENSIFCAAVAEAVVSTLPVLRALETAGMIERATDDRGVAIRFRLTDRGLDAALTARGKA